MYQLSWHHSLPPHAVLGVWTVKQGRIESYAPADAFPAVGVADIDADKRPDLLLDSRGEFLGPDGRIETHTSFNPDGVAHALPNGSFSTNDAVAKQATRDQPWN